MQERGEFLLLVSSLVWTFPCVSSLTKEGRGLRTTCAGGEHFFLATSIFIYLLFSPERAVVIATSNSIFT